VHIVETFPLPASPPLRPPSPPSSQSPKRVAREYISSKDLKKISDVDEELVKKVISKCNTWSIKEGRLVRCCISPFAEAS
jgi:hypothetical protein